MVNNGEFYLSREDNYIGENKPFPAEIYKKPQEENPLGKEAADNGREITTLQKKRARAKNGDGSAKSLVDRIFNSIKGVATTATVAVSAIVVTTTVITGAMNVEMSSIDVGSDYIEAQLEISDIGDDGCFAVLTASGELVEETEITEDGVHTVRFEGLLPECEYTLSVVSRSTVLGETVHLAEKLQTEKRQEYEPDPPEPPPDSYTGNLVLPDIGTAAIDWRTGEMTLPIQFEKIGDSFYYRLVVSDTDGNELQEIRGDDSITATVNITADVDEYKFTFEIYGVGESEVKLIASQELGTRTVARPTAEILGVSLVGQNLARVSFSLANADGLAIYIPFGEEGLAITAGQHSIECGYIDVSLPDTAMEISITPIITVDGYELTLDSFTHVFETNLELEAIVDISTGTKGIKFYLKALTNAAYYLHVVNTDTGEEMNLDFYGGFASMEYSEDALLNLSAYLTNDEGERLSNEVSLTVNTTAPTEPSDYIMNYKNPSEVGVTYNEDGTINVYVYTDFESEDESYYSRITLGEYTAVTRDKVTVFRGLPNTSYSINYSVCFERDGQTYMAMTVTPSGMVNESYLSIGYELIGDTLTMTVYDESVINLDSITVTALNGEQITLSAGDFTLDEYENRVATVTFATAPELVTVNAQVCPFARGLELIEEFEGSVYTEYTEEIFPY